MATSANGQPVQVDRGPLKPCRSADACAYTGNRHVATIPGPVDGNNGVDRPPGADPR
jgi:hypothetical protein